ncbi:MULTISPECIES: cytochrome P450 [Nocardioidaceae]|jgi:cytochrome P450|uniref:Cytochrome P450 n=6 Tax=Nocardioidaceae TaxID=85015 RepID=A0A6G7YFZ1_9ACTN|nr:MULTISPECIES: cytochrome P450 [Nocardioides]MBA4084283.1 cytochrome P450 [Kytococcus sp.]GEO89237.1 cytochrome P450 [Aeromicrobium flavum]ANH39563.1 Cytochrome P450 130 [Nocardioides dokdonensis FR1436]MBM7508161.1 cytochrome P450 [Nocardioides salarius]MDI6912359.1 cytochrome P450 [Nocardioides sp.]
MSDQPLTYSPFDAEVIADPYPVYRELRANSPAHWSREANSWVLSRYDDVSAALADPATYSSASGIFPTPPGVDMTELFLPMLIMSDPPRHTQLRQIVSRAFTPRRIAALEPHIETLVKDLLDQTPEAGNWEFVSGFAGPLPAIVIADMLGVPRDDRDQFRAWSTTLIQSNPVRGEFGAGLDAAAALYEYFTAFLAERRAHPQDDLMTALVQAEVDGEYLSEEELLGFCLLLLVAGHETTTNLLSNSAVVLAQHPDVRQQLADDPELVPAAVEELLRFDSPVQGLARTLTAPVELHGESMQTGDTVLLLFGSANRDDHAFPHADRFDVNRHPERQVAFGRGIHFCLGASLARLEARIALQTLLTRRPDWDVDLDAAVRLHSGPIRGYISLPMQ